jgi:DNA repair protein RadC
MENYIVKETNAFYKSEPTPEERLISYGQKNLSNQELLALVLQTGYRNETSLQLAQRVLERFSTLYDLKVAALEELMEIEGIGKSKALKIISALEFGRRTQLANQEIGMSVHSSYSLAQKLIQEMKGYQQEHLCVIFLNTKNQIIKQKTIFIGSLNESIAHPQPIFRDAVKFNACSILIYHNHPSNNTTPSKNDDEVTKRIKEAGDMVGIKLLDHLVIGEQGYFSYREEGRLN